MTTSMIPPAAPAAARPPLLSRALALRFVTVIGASANFFLLLSVVPLYATASSGAGAAGVATSALMLATVIGELAAPRLVARYGHRGVLAAGPAPPGAPA